MSAGPQEARIGDVLRYGDGVATLPDGRQAAVPYTLPHELVEIAPRSEAAWSLVRIRDASEHRIEPGCPHFGVCGGCHLQMASYPKQLELKRDVLLDWLRHACIQDLPALQTHAAEPWGYRNRIRLRVGRDAAGLLRFGYNERASHHFLPVHTCPISAPSLWTAAETTLAAARACNDLHAWLNATAEVELFTDNRQERLQLSLLVESRSPVPPVHTFAPAMDTLKRSLPALAGAGTARLGGQQRGRERTRTPVTSWDAAGLSYTVDQERYWVARGGFFQVNRFLLPDLVRLVCADRHGRLAWDLFAGVGLFARELAKTFGKVTAVEGSAGAARDLAAAFAGRGGRHNAVQQSTLDFLREAVLQRERPELITLDPPRAGAGEAACELLLGVGAPEIVYISCDPETLARDLRVLQRGYILTALHLVDMFPQTFHQETVVVLQRRS